MEKIMKVLNYFIGLVVYAGIFIAAMVFAYYGHTVLGWFIAVLALAWFVLAVFSEIGIRSVLQFYHKDKKDKSSIKTISLPSADQYRKDMQKISHALTIINTQTHEALEALEKPDTSNVKSALEAVNQASHNIKDSMPHFSVENFSEPCYACK